MNQEAPPSARAGCLATLVSVAAVALILTVAIFPTSLGSPAMYIPVFIVTTIVVVIIGLPQYLLVMHFGRQSIWTAIAVGATTGMALPLLVLFSAPTRDTYEVVAAYAAVGIVGGVVFFLTATAARNPARNLSILLALTGTAVALAAPVSSLISPAPSSTAR